MCVDEMGADTGDKEMSRYGVAVMFYEGEKREKKGDREGKKEEAGGGEKGEERGGGGGEVGREPGGVGEGGPPPHLFSVI